METEALTPTYIRAKNGSLYKDATIRVAGGLIDFPLGFQVDAAVTGELVQWIPENGMPRPADEILDEALGEQGWGLLRSLGSGAVEVAVPDSGDPPRVASAVVYAFEVVEAIPEPTTHDGFQRYTGRCRPGKILELPI